jgi:predicted PurR-regulated permease PerM
MSMPPPTERQTRVLWFSLTAFAVAIVLGLIGMLIWGLSVVLQILTPVLLPLAVAGIIAYLLDPVVDSLERKKVPRTRAILVVFLAATLVFAGVLGAVVPQLVYETRALIERVPVYARKLQERYEQSFIGQQVEKLWEMARPTTNAVDTATNAAPTEATAPESTAEQVISSPISVKVISMSAQILPTIGTWLLDQLQRVGSWIGWLLGFVLVPVYVFYFLKEKSGITRNWQDYLPLRESKAKEELIFILSQINDCLIVFFRGQVLVAICTGTLLTIGFLSLGLNYAFLLGAMAGVLGIIPYLGVLVSLIPAVTLAAVQYGDWLHPLLVLGIFGLVNLLEGFVISPKIIGDRVGLHPLTIIIAVMFGTTLMGGILGGVLAIPLTAALRAIMFRYVWKQTPAALAAKTSRKK